MFDILSKEVRFVDWGLSEEELAPGSPEREASFMKLIENIERRLRRRERIYVFSKFPIYLRFHLDSDLKERRLYGIRVDSKF